MSNKEVLQKLLNIASNQQKILTKLAQAVPAPSLNAPLIEADLKLEPLQNLLNSFVKTRNPSAVGKLKLDAAKIKGSGEASVNISFPRPLQGLFDQVSQALQSALLQIPLQDVIGTQHKAKSAIVIDNPV